MGDKTGIEWTDATWNPLAAFDRETGKRGWFCTKVSPGCKHCYAEALNQRLGTGHAYAVPNLEKVEFRLVNLDQPLRWRKPRRVFVNSMTDLFHEEVPFEMVDRVFATMGLATDHIFQILTKRPERQREYVVSRREQLETDPFGARLCRLMCDLSRERGDPIWPNAKLDIWRTEANPLGFPTPNVWLGTSVEDQKRADERIPHLLATPAAVRFLSCEPLLGPVNLKPYLFQLGEWIVEGELDWIIVGGESGQGARPMEAAWARDIRDVCRQAGTAFFLKQMGKVYAGSGKGGKLADIPPDLRIREMPRELETVP